MNLTLSDKGLVIFIGGAKGFWGTCVVFRRNGTERGYRKLTASEGMGFIRILHRVGGGG